MTTNPVVILAAEMLEAAKHTVFKVHVCYHNNKIKAHPSNHALDVHPIFGTWTADEIQKGLTAEQWCALGERVGEFLRSKS